MYIDGNKIYADAGETLVAGEGCAPVDSLIGGISDGITFEKARVFNILENEILMFNNGYTMLLPKEKTFDAIYETFVKLGYTEELQIKLIKNKDKSGVDETNYKNMLIWMDFSDKAAKLACPVLDVEIEETLESVKNEKLKEIEKYDSSSEVNSFMYNGMSFWLDKATRVGLMNSTAILQNAGESATTLWLGDINLTLPCQQVILILSQVEMYALECYNVTAEHSAKVSHMTDIDEIKAYDYRTGYPENPVFGTPPVSDENSSVLSEE